MQPEIREGTETAGAAEVDAGGAGMDGVAVVGMSVRLPGAASLDEYWSNLRAGVESIRFFSDPELLAAGVEPALLADPNYVKARGALDGVELFDADFFGFTPREAETMDPQHRLFLEEAWAALEHAGCDADTYEGAIGVFAGANLTAYLLRNLAPNEELVKRVGPLQIRIRNDKDFLATLVAYKLNLKGPAVNVQTACSSSLVGVSLACQSLLSYQCDMALAGGISVSVPSQSGYLYQEGVYAPDGHCRAFDARARGTVLGDGVAVVVLKRLEDAQADGDTVHAVIRGFAVNNDGGLKLDYTAPSVDGQAEVISMAQALGEIDPESVTYIEAHGTGTPLGDPIEITALTQAFRAATDARGFCGLGSVKTNIGHLDAAAGTAGMVKAVLALTHRELPPTLHFTQPNPQLDLAASPFYVVDRLQPWPAAGSLPRRAGVSSFGVGGTNAHVVLEEAPAPAAVGPSRPWQLLVLSARSPEALAAAAANLAAHLGAHPEQALADVAFTLARGRKPFELRQALVCRDPADAAAVLGGAAPRRVALGGTHSGGARPGAVRPLAFLFSGIGDHYVGMGRDLYEQEPVFRAAVDRCAGILAPYAGFDVREILYPPAAVVAVAAPPAAGGSGPDLRRMLGRAAAVEDPGAERLDQTVHLHPALFVLEYALAQQWLAWGIRPRAMIGYSIGEYVAACLAGVFSLTDALRLVAERARIIERQPGGAMLAVSLPEAETARWLAEPRFEALSLAAVNGPAFCVVAGTAEEVAALAAALDLGGVTHRLLKARHPFHSRRLAPVLADFRAALSGISLAAPEIPFLSNVTGAWITAEEATDPGYWAEHMLRTVRFGDGVAVLLADGDWTLLEIGPGQSLSSIALQSAGEAQRSQALPSLPHDYDPQPAQAFLLHSLGRLWSHGTLPDWKAFYGGEERRRVPLPTYPFERRRYWIDPVPRQAALPTSASRQASLDKKPDPGDWFYLPVWRQERLTPPDAASHLPAGADLVLMDETGLGHELAAHLAARGREVVTVEVGDAFAELGDRRFAVDPGRAEDYETLFSALAGQRLLPGRIVHLWSLPAAPVEALEGADVLERGFYSLLSLTQAWANVAGKDGRELSLTVVSSGALEVTGDEELEPEKATLTGPCRVIPQEVPGIRCRQIDLPRPTAGEGYAQRWVASLAAELEHGQESLVAWRGRRRWLRGFEAVPPGPAAEGGAAGLRSGGVYLLTGGLGGIGLTLAMWLAERCQARLVLSGRSPFPPRESWPAWLAEHSPDDPTSLRIRRLGEIEAAGAEILICQADVTSREQMEEVRRLARQRFGTIHGVIHAAGQPPGGLAQLKSREQAAAVLAPKLLGTRILDQVFAGPDLDFLLLCSSLTSLTGALGLVDHAAANAFLDAYAHWSRSTNGSRPGGAPVVSVNWDSWLEVGQAAEAGVAARLETLIDGGAATEEMESGALFPRFERRAGDGEEILESRLPAGHWLLAEHRFEGVGLLPGTAYLELMRSAVEEHAAGRSIVLRDVVFAQPCRVESGQSRRLRLRLRPIGEGFSAAVLSASAGGAGWVEHAHARIETVPAAAGESHGFAAPAARCAPREIRFEDDPEAARVAFGERWRGLLRELRVGDREGWARLELPQGFAGDLDDFGLHPALADVATGIGRVLGEGVYLPASYDEVRIHGRLPARLQSHFRLRQGVAGGAATLVFDVTVGDPEGRVLLEAQGYTMRLLEGRGVQSTAGEGRGKELPARDGDWSLGLRPQEGAEVFGRLLASRLDEPQVVVSVRDFSAVLTRMESLTGGLAAEHLAALGAAAGSDRGRRGVSHAPYLAPRNRLEETLVELYQDMLGVGEVGIHDNFFDLGGNSLVATQLLSRVRETFEVEIALRALFEAPSVAELVVVIVREQASTVDEDELSAALDELSRLSPEELRQRLAEEELAAREVADA